MALTLKKPIAQLHKKEQHISVQKLRNAKRRDTTQSKARKFQQLSLFK